VIKLLDLEFFWSFNPSILIIIKEETGNGKTTGHAKFTFFAEKKIQTSKFSMDLIR
jgi:hypothetical protein